MSGRKNVILPVKVLTAGSLGASINSSPTGIQYQDNISYQINILSGTPSGTFSVQGSLDYSGGGSPNPTSPVAGNWIDISGLSVTVTSGSPANILFNLSQLAFPYIRIAYTRTSSTGTADIFVSSKEL